jgi:hypothetical protein
LADDAPPLALLALLLRIVAELLELSPDPLTDFDDSLAGADADIFAEFAHPFAR